jgi:hypothetical protein
MHKFNNSAVFQRDLRGRSSHVARLSSRAERGAGCPPHTPRRRLSLQFNDPLLDSPSEIERTAVEVVGGDRRAEINADVKGFARRERGWDDAFDAEYARLAMLDHCHKTNLRPCTQADMERLLGRAW